MKIRKKPMTLDAWRIDTAELQYHGNVLDWVHDEYQANNGRLAVVSDGQKMVLRIRTLEGIMTAEDGDVLVKGIAGELYSIRRSIFDQTYDVIDAENAAQSAMSPPHVEVVSTEQMTDGGLKVLFEMDYDTMKLFAKKAVYQVLMDAANRVKDEHGLS